MKYILVTGGVISGIGKGIISSSIGTILKAYGWNVTCIKIDPYLNIDAGTFSPYEHGEVYVLDDGSEVDLDLGNYERFLDITLTKDNNITTGKIYQRVMEKERRGDYLGKTVQVVPHITDTIMQWVVDVAQVPVDESGQTPEVCIIELGGTIGDIESMPFVEAFRQMLFRVGCSNFCCVHVSLVPQLSSVGEPKTKPTQASVRELRACGLHPDLIMCRCTSALPKAVIDKISLFSQVPVERVLTVMDVGDLYEVPIRLDKQGVCRILLEHFRLSTKPKIEHPVLGKWQALTHRLRQATRPVRVAVVGKYTKLNDAYLSLLKALRHAAIYANCKLDTDLVCCENLEEHMRLSNPDQFHQAWLVVSSCDAVVVAGGFGPRGLEGKLAAIRFCRERGVPFLGLCLGLQCAVIEFARNVLDWKDANTTEFDPGCKHPVVIDMPEYNPGQMGGTMRLGRRRTAFYLSDTAATYVNQTYGHSTPLVTGCGDGPVVQPSPTSSIVHRLINAPFFDARHRHRYEVNPTVVDELEAAGLIIVGRDAEVGDRMEVIELMRPLSTDAMQNDHFPNSMTSDSNKIRPTAVHTGPVRHPYFVATQFHPEYTSRPAHPSMFFVGLILAASNQLDSYLHSPFRLSPTVLLEELNGRGCSVALPSGASLPALEDKPSEHNHICYVSSLNTALPSSNLNSDSELDAALTRTVNFHIGDYG
ncbi:CTP synthase [Paragonimus westermani]|uniref:CTP synthase n=1 Tax=Paragonimus westermani TaxID=34504 RepID=A0A5J4NHT6_9TREM|nr:CTP synthase [Paragonimus westermani]